MDLEDSNAIVPAGRKLYYLPSLVLVVTKDIFGYALVFDMNIDKWWWSFQVLNYDVIWNSFSKLVEFEAMF